MYIYIYIAHIYIPELAAAASGLEVKRLLRMAAASLWSAAT
jgi:hypothetical protein